MSQHVDENLMDQYSLGMLPENECAELEEHLLICETCRQRVAQSDAFARSVRGAGSVLVMSGGSGNPAAWASRGAMAVGALLVVAAGLAAWHFRPAAPLPAVVMLQATRGLGEEPQAPAQRALDLRLDLTDLPAPPPYQVEIVDQYGTPVIHASASAASVPVASLRPGLYFVRLYAPGGVLLREYGLEAVAR